MKPTVDRRAFLAAGLQTLALSKNVMGANDRIRVGVVGVGGRGTYVGRAFGDVGKDANTQVVAVCDVYQKRINSNKDMHATRYNTKVDGFLDYKELIARKDIDAVVVSTPDHWHARIAIAAMEAGKDVYCEKPMCHTVEEVKQLIDTVKRTGRVMQVGSQTTSGQRLSLTTSEQSTACSLARAEPCRTPAGTAGFNQIGSWGLDGDC